MGRVIRFPENAGDRRARAEHDLSAPSGASIIILPVIRIERHAEDAGGGSGPETGAAPGRRRRRRARS
jgi:hypothetical protein